jgi:triphosphatase
MRAQREMPIEIYASEQLSHRYKRVRRRGARINKLDPEQLHRLRIQVKKARYATEFFSSLYDGKKAAKQCKKMKSTLMQLQGSLGRLNDIVTHKALFAGIIDHPARGLTGEQSRHRAFAAGLIIGDQQARTERLLDRARKAHSRFAHGKVFWKLPSRSSTAAVPVAEKQL